MRVYKITCLKNGKVYIGQTIKSLKYRFDKHIFCAIRNGKNDLNKFYHAIRKHGKESFIVEEIELCNSVEELNIREQYYIEKYNSMINGYNSTTGGKNFIASEYTRTKISKANRGRVFSDEHRKNISLNKKGKPSGTKGYPMPENVRIAIIKAQLGRKCLDETKKKISNSLKPITTSTQNAFYGKKHSKETIDKMKIKRIGRKPNFKLSNEQIVKIIELLILGTRIRDISKIYPLVNRSRISQIKGNWIKLTEK